jgi:membrane-bound serine protease (ClpP class)
VVVAAISAVILVLGLIAFNFVACEINDWSGLLEGFGPGKSRSREKAKPDDPLLGQVGIATTNLLPGGRIEVDGELVDVVTRGEPVDRGDTVEVIETHANRVVVRRVQV